MRTSIFLTLASVALLLVGCSKEELTENVSEGVSSVATPAGGHARLGDPDAIPEIWFNQNQGRMVVQFSASAVLPQNCRPSGRISYTIAGGQDPDGNPTEETVVMEAELLRVGNSRIYRSAQDEFVFGQTDHFSLVDVKIDWNAADGTLQEESRIETQLFLYPSGRTVEQDPKVVMLRRFHFQDQIVAEWDATLTDELRITVADDPAQTVAQVKLVSGPTYPNPDDPTYVVYPEPTYLEKTHVNEALGLSRWIGTSAGPSGTTDELILLGDYVYGVDFLAGESNAQIISKYNLTENEAGAWIAVLSDEPVILGTRLSSRDKGLTWVMEVAMADLGNWVNSVNYRVLETNGPATAKQETQLMLVRQEGNLKIFSNMVFFTGNPLGSDYQALITGLGTGTRTTTGQANNKAELL